MSTQIKPSSTHQTDSSGEYAKPAPRARGESGLVHLRTTRRLPGSVHKTGQQPPLPALSNTQRGLANAIQKAQQVPRRRRKVAKGMGAKSSLAASGAAKPGSRSAVSTRLKPHKKKRIVKGTGGQVQPHTSPSMAAFDKEQQQLAESIRADRKQHKERQARRLQKRRGKRGVRSGVTKGSGLPD